jgi:hypothetical protein
MNENQALFCEWCSFSSVHFDIFADNDTLKQFGLVTREVGD